MVHRTILFAALTVIVLAVEAHARSLEIASRLIGFQIGPSRNNGVLTPIQPIFPLKPHRLAPRPRSVQLPIATRPRPCTDWPSRPTSP